MDYLDYLFQKTGLDNILATVKQGNQRADAINDAHNALISQITADVHKKHANFNFGKGIDRDAALKDLVEKEIENQKPRIDSEMSSFKAKLGTSYGQKVWEAEENGLLGDKGIGHRLLSGLWGSVKELTGAGTVERAIKNKVVKPLMNSVANDFKAGGVGAVASGAGKSAGKVGGGLLGGASKLFGWIPVPKLEGLAMSAGTLGIGLAGAGLAGLKGAEFGARVLLTGGTRGVASNALEAWLPGMGVYNWSDPRKYLLNPKVGRRLVGLGMIAGLGAGFSEIVSPKGPPPSYYLEAGGQIRHVRDMGASAKYGQAVMGPNSLLNQWQSADPSTKRALLDMVI